MQDFISDLAALNGYVMDKIKDFTIDTTGKAYAVTENEDINDSSGETFFFEAGDF